ncbi:CLC_0170 family protein [Clostridium tunisiense]|uniref:CLC_0170 family protein n=1 Tax=Clostridium tunisiense TaxID=219748 RepID=UPI0003161E65|nr:CLC_0170 family protein [Clostridium tunisiense]
MRLMIRTIIERFDLYLLILSVATGILVAYFDAKKFKTENKQTAYKQARYFGIGVAALAIALYIVRFMFI